MTMRGVFQRTRERAIIFKQFLETGTVVSAFPENYIYLIARDILGMTKEEFLRLSFEEYLDVANYVTTTYIIRASMIQKNTKNGKGVGKMTESRIQFNDATINRLQDRDFKLRAKFGM